MKYRGFPLIQLNITVFQSTYNLLSYATPWCQNWYENRFTAIALRHYTLRRVKWVFANLLWRFLNYNLSYLSNKLYFVISLLVTSTIVLWRFVLRSLVALFLFLSVLLILLLTYLSSYRQLGEPSAELIPTHCFY